MSALPGAAATTIELPAPAPGQRLTYTLTLANDQFKDASISLEGILSLLRPSGANDYDRYAFGCDVGDRCESPFALVSFLSPQTLRFRVETMRGFDDCDKPQGDSNQICAMFFDPDLFVGFDTLNGDYALSYNSIASAIPEPSTWALFIIGFGAIGFASRRRARAEHISRPA
jgi:hypothetical protein